MRLKPIRHLWVLKSLGAGVSKIKAEGFEGIEFWLDSTPDLAHLRSLCNQNNLECVATGATGGRTIDEHVKSFEALVKRAREVKPILLESTPVLMLGTPAKSKHLQQAVAIEQQTDLVIGHETHRGRVFYNPWSTRDTLQKFPELRLVCDFSHWVCVAERLNWDDMNNSILKLAADRCVHIHTRVGYPRDHRCPIHQRRNIRPK